MKKKYSISEENVYSNSPKNSEILRRNPRLPYKMKLHKCSTSNIRTMGQLSGKHPFPTMIGRQNFSRGELGRSVKVTVNDVEDMTWTKLRRTFSNTNRSPRGTYDADKFPTSQKFDFCAVVPIDPQTDSSAQTQNNQHVCVTSKPSKETGVQVDMFHCKECRRHIKYGKHFKLDNSCTESDSESNLCTQSVPKQACVSCNRIDSTTNLPNNDDVEIEGSKKSDHEEELQEEQLSPPQIPYTPSQNGDISPRKADTSPSQTDNVCGTMKLVQKIGGKQSPLTNLKLVLLITLFLPLIVGYLVSFSDVFLYVTKTMGRAEVHEENLFSLYKIVEFFFCVSKIPSPVSVFMYLL